MDRAATPLTMNKDPSQTGPSPSPSPALSSHSQHVVPKKKIVPFRTPFLSQPQSQSRDRPVSIPIHHITPNTVYPRPGPQLPYLSAHRTSSPTPAINLHSQSRTLPSPYLDRRAPTPARNEVASAPKSSFVASLIQETLARPPPRSNQNQDLDYNTTPSQNQLYMHAEAFSSTPSLSHSHSTSKSSLDLGRGLDQTEYGEEDEVYNDNLEAEDSVYIGDSRNIAVRYEDQVDEYGGVDATVALENGNSVQYPDLGDHSKPYQNAIMGERFVSHTFPPPSQSRKRTRSESLSPVYHQERDYPRQRFVSPASPSPPSSRPRTKVSSLPVPSAPRKQPTSSRHTATRPISTYAPHLRAHVSSDCDDEEVWSTLPAKKKRKNVGGGGGVGRGIVSTAKFRLPLSTPSMSRTGGDGGGSEDGGNGAKRSGSGKRIVKGFRPPPPRDREKETNKSTDDEALDEVYRNKWDGKDENGDGGADGLGVGGGWKLVMIGKR